jgi:hypothetical protein
MAAAAAQVFKVFIDHFHELVGMTLATSKYRTALRREEKRLANNSAGLLVNSARDKL